MCFQELLIEKEKLFLKTKKNINTGVKSWDHKSNIFSIYKDNEQKKSYNWCLNPAYSWDLPKEQKLSKQCTEILNFQNKETKFPSMPAAKQNALDTIQQIFSPQQFAQIQQQVKIINGISAFILLAPHVEQSPVSIIGRSKKWFIGNDSAVGHIYNYNTKFSNMFLTKQQAIDYMFQIVSDNLYDIYQKNKKEYQYFLQQPKCSKTPFTNHSAVHDWWTIFLNPKINLTTIFD